MSGERGGGSHEPPETTAGAGDGATGRILSRRHRLGGVGLPPAAAGSVPPPGSDQRTPAGPATGLATRASPGEASGGSVVGTGTVRGPSGLRSLRTAGRSGGERLCLRQAPQRVPGGDRRDERRERGRQRGGCQNHPAACARDSLQGGIALKLRERLATPPRASMLCTDHAHQYRRIASVFSKSSMRIRLSSLSFARGVDHSFGSSIVNADPSTHDAAAVALDDRSDDRQPEPRARAARPPPSRARSARTAGCAGPDRDRVLRR